ncbi:hypothetical protein [Flavobacterium sp. IMCC34518]|uniref:hypothetical protein n=1 Tax=Flavobacterium sp. IMCC34518 TaxID=3003623 RepID=UPI0022AC10E3|nr:hypothetical protein [Flavobacterium sp. IMCC34518]
MLKIIFLVSVFFFSMQSFSQKAFSNPKIKQSFIPTKEIDIELLAKDNLCEILSIKVSDLLNESMLKKLKANV